METTLDGLIREVLASSEDPLQQLDAASMRAAELADLGDSLLTHFVDRCRTSGHTWAEIGEHLGVTRQAAQKRFVDTIASAGLFSRFTDRTRLAIVRSEDAARALQHNYIGTEHLLLALYDVDGALSKAVLERLGVKRSTLRKAIVAAVGKGTSKVTGSIPFTPRAKKVLEQTVEVAVDLGHNYVGTEHLLLALYRGQDGLAKQLLEDAGVTEDAARAEVIDILKGFTGPAT